MLLIGAEPQLSQYDLNAQSGAFDANAESDSKAIFAFTQRLLRRRLMT
jgi:hypothetical protein